MLTFVEDEKFARAADRLPTDGERFELMAKLVKAPEAGKVIPGSGGCQIYAKNEKEDLSADEVKNLKSKVKS